MFKKKDKKKEKKIKVKEKESKEPEPRRLVRVLKHPVDETMEDSFEDTFEVGDESKERILTNMVKDDEHLPMKSRIASAIKLTQIELMGYWADIEMGKNIGKETEIPSLTGTVFRIFSHGYRVNSVSQDGKSRDEIITALSTMERQIISEPVPPKKMGD